MTDAHSRTHQASPSPRTLPPVLPPLSKFYCGPAQGWNSAEASPSHNDSTWSLTSPQHEAIAALPARASPAPPAPSSAQWQKHFVNAYEDIQGWQNHLPSHSTPDDPHVLPSEPAHDSINAGWDSRPTSSSIDTSTWGVNYTRKNLVGDEYSPRPNLPLRTSLATNGAGSPREQSSKRVSPSSKYSSQHLSARGSATTIDVPLFLQPHPFDPETAPPLPDTPMVYTRTLPHSMQSSPQPSNIPPRPPKIPMSVLKAAYDDPAQTRFGYQRIDSQDQRAHDTRNPKYDHQKPLHGGHSKQDSQGSLSSTTSLKRPRFDPQNSHNDGGHQASIQTGNRVNPQGSPQLPPVANSYGESEADRSQSVQRLHQGSVSPVHENDRWPMNQAPTRWESPAGYVPSPELQHAVLPQQDGRSTTTTDVSSNLPAASTPESQQTSNTSYKGSEAQVEAASYEEESNDSFYWHSGRSSSEGEEDHSRKHTLATQATSQHQATRNRRSGYESASTARGNSFATQATESRDSRTTSKGIPTHSQEGKQSPAEYQMRSLPTRSSSLSPNPAVSYTASALGIGGPSDWEYFGDYEAEEIDDEELYAHKPRAELAADYQPVETTQLTVSHNAISETNASHETSIPHIIQEQERSDTRMPDMQLYSRTVGEPSVLESKWSPSTTTPTTPHGNSSRPITVTSEPMPTEEHRPDLEDVIRAWSDSPYIGRLPDTDESGSAGLKTSRGHDNAAEASLASTPGENVLGIYAIPKDAPPLPKLPDPIDLEALSSANEFANLPSIDADSPKKNEIEAIEPRPDDPPHHHDMDINTQGGGASNTVCNPPVETSRSIDAHPSPTVQSSKNRPDESSAASPMLVMDRSPIAVEVARTAGGRTSSPSSDFARKRQLFESTAEKKAPSSPFQRKPLRALKQVSSDLSLKDGKRTPVSDSSEQSVSRKPQTTSADTSGQGPQIGFPASSKNSSNERMDHMSNESIRPDSTTPIGAKGQDLSRPTPAGFSSADSVEDKPPSQAKKSPTTQAQDHASITSSERLPQALSSVTPSPTANVMSTSAQASQMIKSENFQAESKPPQASTQIMNEGGAIVEPVLHQFVDYAEDEQHEPEISFDGKALETHLGRPVTNNDPYADLDPWGRASLNRFAAMLREEARAESNKDKLNIFDVFTTRESRLRVVLYGSDEDLIISQKLSGAAVTSLHRVPSQKLQHLAKATSLKKLAQKGNTGTLQQRKGKELPPLPPNRDSVVGPPVSKLAHLAVNANVKTDGSADPLESPSEGSEYSPGGRPIVKPQSKATEEPERDFEQSNIEGGEGATETARPAYVRPQFNENGGEVKNYLTNRRSVYRPFATQTAESMDNAKNFAREAGFSLDAPPLPHKLAIPTGEKNTFEKISGKQLTEEKSLDLRRFVEADFDPLIMVLPKSDPSSDDSQRLADLKIAMDAVPDDFSFIHESVVSWDTKIKKQREANEGERHARQIESEQRIDALFDDHEIGYGDIAELEGDFKQSEAAKKAEEDRWEYGSFVEDVFNLVWTRLNFELDQLKPHYERYSMLMNETLAGRESFESRESLALAPTMTSFLGLHQKLEIRYQKAFEAVLERDRRLKKTEISPWYSLSNLEKVKQLEKQFEDAEKQAIIEYCEQRDVRANKLMDVLDQNTLRGVGANQDYMEAIMKAIRRIAAGRAFASVPASDRPTLGIDLVEKAKAMTTLLGASSEQIVQTFHVADMLLNNADYEVSVAKAKVGRADIGTLARLKEERAKEDQKLMGDLEHRLALIRDDCRRTNDEIIKLMVFLGVQNSRAFNTQPAPTALGGQKRPQQQPQDEEVGQDATAGAQDLEREAHIEKASGEAES